MDICKKQLRKLYAMNFLGNISIAGAAWVLLLVSCGYSIIEIGILETVFHLVSLTAEIPSGVFADVFGRKKSLLLSCVCSVISAVTRIFWIGSFVGVAVSIGFNALSYNFASGSDSAIAYDTLKENNKQDDYDRYISTQTMIYRISNGAATLAAGVAVMLGNTKAHIISIILAVIQILVAVTLKENKVISDNADKEFTTRVKETVGESLLFLKGNRKVTGLIFRNALIGGIDVLLLFFLQAKLPMTGISDWVLGPLLFAMSLGGIIGAVLSVKVRNWPFRRIFMMCLAVVTAGFFANFTGVAWIMTAGGFMAAFADDLIQIRADVELNALVPSEQRATLISVNSWCFSFVMIFMSPLAGVLFSL
ncbi:MAG: MFS transporter [Saccharofermentans sp.]|nr:MFS transporter [Saccharofermentans sp.]